MLSFEISLGGVDKVLTGLGKAQISLEGLNAPLHQVGDLLLKDVQANFDSHGALYGGWQGLALSTYEEKAKKGYSTYTLVRTGAMEHGFRAPLVSSSGLSELRLYNTQDYFKYHQSSGPRAKLPRRVMLKLREQMTEEITKLFKRHIADALKEASG